MAARKRTHRSSAVSLSLPEPTFRGYFRALLLCLCIFVLMLILSGITGSQAQRIFGVGTREGLLASNVVQDIIAFFGTAIMTSFFISTRPFDFMGCKGKLRFLTVFNIIICFILGWPFLNQVIFWNSQMHFPEGFASLESWMRQLEETAGAHVELLLGVSSVGALIVNLLVIGVLTGFCEEIFFRGTLQRILGSHGVNKHLAVWMASFIFSLLHFQFFGFFPRLILGAFFGYIFLWTGSIWASSAAHAIFNSVTVVQVWLLHRGINAEVVESFGVQTSSFPWISLISLALVIIYIFVQRRSRTF